MFPSGYRNKCAKLGFFVEVPFRPEKPAVLFCLLVLVFASHLICMNLAAGGPLIASSVELLGQRSSAQAAKLAGSLVAYATIGLIAGALLGGCMLLFFWSPSYQDVFLRRLGSRPAFSLVQVLFSLALHAILWRWTVLPSSSSGAGRGWRALLAVISSTNLLYHFPTLFAIVSEIATTSTPQSEVIGRKQFYAFLSSGPILSHAAHFFLAAIATTGVVGALLTREEPAPSAFRRICTSFALVSTLLQIPIGIMVYMTLPAAAQRALIGDNLPLSIAFLSSLAAVLWLVQSLVGQLPSDAPKSKPLWSAAALAITIVLMSGVLWGTRPQRLNPKTTSTKLFPEIATQNL
jgi:hypothetical protein